MEHDDTCRQHDLGLATLTARVMVSEADLSTLVERTQRLVDQFHEQNLSIERLTVEIRHLVATVAALQASLKTDLVSQSEFSGLRKVVYWIVGIGSTIATGIVVALLTRRP